MFGRLAFVVILASLGTSVASGQEEKFREFKGTIRQLDVKSGSLALKLLSSDTSLALNLASRDLPVTNAVGEKIPLEGLREEHRIAAKVRGEDEVVAIRLDGPFVHGTVREVHPASRTIHFKDPFGEKAIQVPMGVKVVTRDGESSLEKLKAGDPVQFLFSLDKKNVLQVNTGKGIAARDPYLRITRYYGILADLDREKRRVQVFVQNIDAGLIKSYEVSPDAFLRLQYHLKPMVEVGFDQFAKWVKVYYFVDRDTGRIVNIDADMPVMVRRKVAKIDARTITVEDEQKEKSLPLDPNVKVLTPKGDGRLSAITPGRIVNCGLSLDRQRVLVVYLWDR